MKGVIMVNETTATAEKSKSQLKKERFQAHNEEVRRAYNESLDTPDLTRAEREALTALSKEVFNSASRWETLLKKGYTELLTEEITEYVPDDKGGEGITRQVKVPLKRRDGALQHVKKSHTVASVKAHMLERKEQLDKIKAEIKKIQDEAKAKKDHEALTKKIHDELRGSAL